MANYIKILAIGKRDDSSDNKQFPDFYITSYKCEIIIMLLLMPSLSYLENTFSLLLTLAGWQVHFNKFAPEFGDDGRESEWSFLTRYSITENIYTTSAGGDSCSTVQHLTDHLHCLPTQHGTSLTRTLKCMHLCTVNENKFRTTMHLPAFSFINSLVLT